MMVIRFLAVGAVFALAACGDDSSPFTVVPLAPAVSTGGAGSLEQTALVGTTVPSPPTVLVTDRSGNPVPDVEVRFEVTSGGGSATPGVATTRADGHASATWQLGTVAGLNELRAVAGDLSPVTFTAIGEPGNTTVVVVLAGDQQVAAVASVLVDTLFAEGRDVHGNVTLGVPVQWSTSDPTADISSSGGVTDSQGRTRAVWTLGTASGAKTVQVRVGDEALGEFSATALADVPTAVVVVSGDGQAGSAGSALPERLVARVSDQYGNGIADRAVVWSVVDGGGTLVPDSPTTDADGLASARYVAGRTPQVTERVTVGSGSLAVGFTAHIGEPDNLVIDRMYVIQTTQNSAGSVPLLAGRDGLLRVFVLANGVNTHAAAVAVAFYQNGVLVRADTLRRESPSVPMVADESDLAESWNLFVPGHLIQPGMSIVAHADPQDQVYEAAEDDNVYPAGGAAVLFDVRELPDFRVRLIPIQQFTPAGAFTGDVRESNKGAYGSEALKMFPMSDFDVDVREVFTTGVGDTRDRSHWSAILAEMGALRVAEGSSRYYYGVIGFQASSFCGLGQLGSPVAAGMDGACGPETAAHEWGHNFGRRHAPCGDPAGPDPDYPYAGASIGVYGIDVDRLALKAPGEYSDLMSYCNPPWVSDYTFAGVFEFRDAEAQAESLMAPDPQPSMVVWGRIESGRLVLEPSFEATTVPSLPAEPGPYRLQWIGEDGTEILSLSFAGTLVDHGEDEIRHFAFAVPMDIAQPASVERIRFSAPGTLLAPVEHRRPAGDGALSDVIIAREGPNRVRLLWDGAATPLIVVRSPDSGAILSFARGSEAIVRTDADELDLSLAPGVGEVRRRVRVR